MHDKRASGGSIHNRQANGDRDKRVNGDRDKRVSQVRDEQPDRSTIPDAAPVEQLAAPLDDATQPVRTTVGSLLPVG